MVVFMRPSGCSSVVVRKKLPQRTMASRMCLRAEVSASYIHDLPCKDEARYGRSSTCGLVATPSAACETNNINPENCSNDGFVTPFSRGYSTNLSWEYPNAIAGINLTPSVFWSHDIKGYEIGRASCRERV